MSNLLHGVSAVNVQGKPVPLPGTGAAGHAAGHGPAQHKPLLPGCRVAQGRTRFPVVGSREDALDSVLAAAICKHSPAGTVVPVSAQVWGLLSESLVPFEKLPWMALSWQNRECAYGMCDRSWARPGK